MMMKMKVKTISPLCSRTILISNPSWALITVSVNPNSLFNSLNNPLSFQWYMYISSVTLCETCHTIVYFLFTAHIYLSIFFSSKFYCISTPSISHTYFNNTHLLYLQFIIIQIPLKNKAKQKWFWRGEAYW